jgi:Zn-dependent M28 family amino/carboxypeptidase
LPQQSTSSATVYNVMGMLPGSDPELSQEAIIISAHLDHIGQSGSVGDTINNGADDNATGVTAVLSLADAYAAMPEAPKRTVIFITFWGEEKGLLGSRHYCANPVWPLEKTVANINIEMIGRPEPGANGKCWGTGWDKSDLGELMAVGAKDVGVLIFQHPTFSGDMLYRASDNAPFVDKGIVAHSFSAGSLHDDYHQPGDEWEKLELKHMTLVIKGLFTGSLPIANGDVTPKKR